MLPLSFLAIMLSATLLAFTADYLRRRRISASLRKLAAEWHMHYAPNDRFQITPRVVDRFPVPGASDLQVTDLIYLPEPELYRYLFSVEYTEGVVRTKKRVRRVGTFCEPRDRACPVGWTSLILAPADLSLVDQYRHLAPKCAVAVPAPEVEESLVPTSSHPA
jgi:hypothetical protein